MTQLPAPRDAPCSSPPKCHMWLTGIILGTQAEVSLRAGTQTFRGQRLSPPKVQQTSTSLGERGNRSLPRRCGAAQPPRCHSHLRECFTQPPASFCRGAERRAWNCRGAEGEDAVHAEPVCECIPRRV